MRKVGLVALTDANKIVEITWAQPQDQTEEE
jgi:hypothetical protein